MRGVRVPVGLRRASELRATGFFVATAVLLVVFVPLIPHQAKSGYLRYTAVNGTVRMNWFFQRPRIQPARNASAYGLSSRPFTSRAGATFSVLGGVRPTGAPGGRVCLILAAATARSSTPAQTAHTCMPLKAGWSRFPAVTLRTAAPSNVYAEIAARGNDGGFEARPLNISRVAG